MAVCFHHFGRDFLSSFAAGFLILTIVAHFAHLDGHVIVYTQGLRDRIVSEGAYHDVLTTEVTDDVWRFKVGGCRRIECIQTIHGAIGVGHGFRVNLTAEVAF